MMRPLRSLAILATLPCFAAISAASIGACVGDDPNVAALPESDASSTPPTNGDGSLPDSSTPGDGGDGGNGGPRCDPKKAFNDVERLEGISTADDENGVWVSADELTAYVAVKPALGSASTFKKSTRSSREVAFSAPAEDPQLAAINAGGNTRSIPSMTADGFVFAFSRNDGVFVSVRGSTTVPFPIPSAARTRATAISAGEPFLAAGGESLALARDNGPNGYEIDDATRDTDGIYGDGGFNDYAVAPGVTNVNDAVHDDRRPVYSPDRLTLVFASNRPPGAGENLDLYIAQRAGTGGTFTSPERMPEPISSPASDLPGTMSNDGCVLYFTSKRAGGFGEHDVYIAKRPK